MTTDSLQTMIQVWLDKSNEPLIPEVRSILTAIAEDDTDAIEKMASVVDQIDSTVIDYQTLCAMQRIISAAARMNGRFDKAERRCLNHVNLTIPVRPKCRQCDGTGRVDGFYGPTVTCPVCRGEGHRPIELPEPEEPAMAEPEPEVAQ